MDEFLWCEPELRQISGGDWLATTPKDHMYRIGTVGDTPEVASRRFEFALDKWRELHERVKSAKRNLAALTPGDE